MWAQYENGISYNFEQVQMARILQIIVHFDGEKWIHLSKLK